MSITKIEPKETRYKNCRFRSRLEARWAVFFDALGIQWEYEKEGYDLPCGAYLPDFWLPQINTWVEVKPAYYSPEDGTRCLQLFLATSFPVLCLSGQPDCKPYPTIEGYDGASVWGYENDLADHRYFAKEKRLYFVSPWSESFKSPSPQSPRMTQWELAAMFAPCEYLIDQVDDCGHAVNAARSARFEFGESG